MSARWLERRIDLALTPLVAESLFDRVRADHVDRGGRFSLRGTNREVVLWSGSPHDPHARAPLASFRLVGRNSARPAIAAVAWDPTVDDAEHLVLTTLTNLLAAADESARAPAPRRRAVPPYSEEFRRRAVAEVVRGVPRAQVCRERGVDKNTLRKWCRMLDTTAPRSALSS